MPNWDYFTFYLDPTESPSSVQDPLAETRGCLAAARSRAWPPSHQHQGAQMGAASEGRASAKPLLAVVATAVDGTGTTAECAELVAVDALNDQAPSLA
jgi:hypothetical protein